MTADQYKKFFDLLIGMKNNAPKAFEELWGKNFREMYLPRPRSPFLAVPAFQKFGGINIGPEVRSSLRQYAEKLLKALHIVATGKTVPSGAKLTTRILSNGSVLQGQGTELFRMKLKHQGIVERNGLEMRDQFTWQYDFNEQCCIITSKFGQSFFIAGALEYVSAESVAA